MRVYRIIAASFICKWSQSGKAISNTDLFYVYQCIFSVVALTGLKLLKLFST